MLRPVKGKSEEELQSYVCEHKFVAHYTFCGTTHTSKHPGTGHGVSVVKVLFITWSDYHNITLVMGFSNSTIQNEINNSQTHKALILNVFYYVFLLVGAPKGWNALVVKIV